ncbi:hypothetical protein CP960_11440 [Malaciobacter halophilus]|uniref:Uncharacterized protein n=1 Tax=Malaciobacter halophilus TaxID=197482 RepID=A0A2N1J0H1_9BACT|nr:hypothetical protein [Malaciobacter halophilus]AXH10354.1 hypothetical protein AHALO_2012 [Malaciobacter halophilus]PKI80049.1 hypothetical protein CP960_11440 [Malaciobacter halophilus]
MTFIPLSLQLLQAVKSNDALKVEELILNSDTKTELIKEHISLHGEESLINLLPKFKSKGLVINIKSLLNI